ncbi:hypothetical protein L6452_09433 [Arctium lappa]|uniref:Uncharacterized protein n=1 Tax=Arctium lappa TaxID=4217 RepID=A0ACB9DKL1_ARCLA|nr:hypothetical protein L6452_09433 [Arctium lappa]
MEGQSGSSYYVPLLTTYGEANMFTTVVTSVGHGASASNDHQHIDALISFSSRGRPIPNGPHRMAISGSIWLASKGQGWSIIRPMNSFRHLQGGGVSAEYEKEFYICSTH